MLTLVFIGILFAGLVITITVHAIVTAPEGYEDSLGFHALADRGSKAPSAPTAVDGNKALARELPPLVGSR